MRLQKFIAQAGVCSRRRAEELMVNGMVVVNDRTIKKLGTKIDPENDRVKVRGKVIKLEEKRVYIMLHKPKGYETTCKITRRKGQGARRTILNLVKIKERIFPVGRLDKDSSGLLILTNDGDYANKMMHPRYEHDKEYVVDVARPLRKAEIRKLELGIRILDKKTSPAKVKVLSAQQISMTIHEGMNRQIRRMLEAVGNRVVDLKRVRVGSLKLGNLKPGQWEKIEPKK